MAMQRKALIIGEAVGPMETVSDVFQRFGFARVEEVPSLNAATARLRNDHYDLVAVAIDRLILSMD